MRLVCSVFVFSIFLALAGVASAAPVSLQVTGTINGGTAQSKPVLAPIFTNGTSVVITLTYDDVTADSNGSPTSGVYNGAVTAMTVSMTGYSASLDPGGSGANLINIRDDSPVDYAVLRNPLMGAAIGPWSVSQAYLGGLLGGGVGSTALFSGDSLTAFTPSLFQTVWQSAASPGGRLNFVSGGFSFATVTFSIDSVTAVPEPSTALLLAMGLGALASRRESRADA